MVKSVSLSTETLTVPRNLASTTKPCIGIIAGQQHSIAAVPSGGVPAAGGSAVAEKEEPVAAD